MKYFRKLKIEDFLLFLFTVCVTSMLLIFGLYSIKNDELNKLSNQFYSDNSIHFNIKELQERYTLSELTKNIQKHNYILFKEKIDDENKDIRAIYLNGRFDQFPIIKGRFFQDGDFFKNKKIAVVGKNVTKLTVINGKKYYNYQGTNFEVIGIMSGDFSSKIDQLVYLNLDGITNKSSTISGSYVLDSNSDAHKAYKKLKDSSKDEIDLYTIKAEKYGSERYFSNNTNNIIINTLFMIVVVIANSMIIYYWFHRNRVLISIQYLIGYEKLRIYLSLYKKCIGTIITSYIVTTIIVLLLQMRNYLYYMNSYNKFICLGILFLVLINSLLCYISYLSFSPKKFLKVLK